MFSDEQQSKKKKNSDPVNYTIFKPLRGTFVSWNLNLLLTERLQLLDIELGSRLS